MNQGILEVIKEEMARVNINILGISELKCMGTGKFDSGQHVPRQRQLRLALLPGSACSRPRSGEGTEEGGL